MSATRTKWRVVLSEIRATLCNTNAEIYDRIGRLIHEVYDDPDFRDYHGGKPGKMEEFLLPCTGIARTSWSDIHNAHMMLTREQWSKESDITKIIAKAILLRRKRDSEGNDNDSGQKKKPKRKPATPPASPLPSFPPFDPDASETQSSFARTSGNGSTEPLDDSDDSTLEDEIQPQQFKIPEESGDSHAIAHSLIVELNECFLSSSMNDKLAIAHLVSEMLWRWIKDSIRTEPDERLDGWLKKLAYRINWRSRQKPDEPV
jgi:hypothetical protein